MTKTDIAHGTIVRRYLTPEKFEYLIKNKSLYMASYSRFSDKLEGGISPADYARNSIEPDLMYSALARLSNIGDKEGFEQRNRESNELAAALKERKFCSIFGELPSEDYEAYLTNAKNWLYACCLHTYDYECHAMWEIYGKRRETYSGSLLCLPENSGFCIEMTIGSVVDNVVLPQGYEFALSSVEYVDHSSAVITDNPLDPFTRKARHFEFEKEARLIAWPTGKDIVFSYRHEQSSINDLPWISPEIKDVNNLITRIIFAPGTPDDVAQRVTQICRSQGITCDMVRSVLDEDPILDFYGWWDKCQ